MIDKKFDSVADRKVPGNPSSLQQPQIAPYSFRLPKPNSVDPYFGGSRTFWNQQVLPCPTNGNKPTVKSVTKKQPGAKRGVRFILYQSAVEFFQRLEREQCAEPAM
jgi:hypothetical protein